MIFFTSTVLKNSNFCAPFRLLPDKQDKLAGLDFGVPSKRFFSAFLGCCCDEMLCIFRQKFQQPCPAQFHNGGILFRFSSYMIEKQKETPQEKPKSTPTVIVIVAHSTSFSMRPKTTGRKWWNGAWRAKGSSSVIHIGALNHISSWLQQKNSGR